MSPESQLLFSEGPFAVMNGHKGGDGNRIQQTERVYQGLRVGIKKVLILSQITCKTNPYLNVFIKPPHQNILAGILVHLRWVMWT